MTTTFTLDQADLIAGGSIIGSTGSDTVAAGGQSLDLSSTTPSSIENLKAALSIATIFTVDQADLVASGSVTGSTGNDTLAIKGTSLDLTSTTLSSVEILAAGSSLATTFTVDAADLLSGGSVVGSSGNDTLIVSNSYRLQPQQHLAHQRRNSESGLARRRRRSPSTRPISSAAGR